MLREEGSIVIGPGKYDDLVTILRTRTHAKGVALMILEGPLGSGFSVQAPTDKKTLLSLANVMRSAAEDLIKQVVGPTGEYPHGKLAPDDEGELAVCMTLSDDKKTIRLQFGKKIDWLGMRRDTAQNLQETLTKLIAEMDES